MASPLESAITLEDVFAMVTGKRVPLAPELAGYLSLEVAEKADAAGSTGAIDPRAIYIADEGTVALVLPRGSSAGVGASGDTEDSIRGILGQLLDASGSSTPALAGVSRRACSGSVRSLMEEIEAALIPVNRAAGRRALARLAREVKRVTHGVGRNAPSGRSPSGEPIARRGGSQPEVRDVRPHQPTRPGPPTPPPVRGRPEPARPVPAPHLEEPRSLPRPVGTSPGVGDGSGGAISARGGSQPGDVDPHPLFENPSDVDSLLEQFSRSTSQSEAAVSRGLKDLVDIGETALPPAVQARPPVRAIPADRMIPTPFPFPVNEAPTARAHVAPPRQVPADRMIPTPFPASVRAPSSTPPPVSARGSGPPSVPASGRPPSLASAPSIRPSLPPSSGPGASPDIDDLLALSEDAPPSSLPPEPSSRPPASLPPPSRPPRAPSGPAHWNAPRAATKPESVRPPPNPRNLPTRQSIPVPAAEWARPKKKRTDYWIIIALLAVLAGAAAIVWLFKPGFLSGRTAEKVAEEKATNEALKEKMAAAQQALSCHAALDITDVPTGAEVLLRVGQAPVDVPHLPVGARLEFVATAEGFAPKRVVVPAGATWDNGADGKPRFEVGAQLDRSNPKAKLGDPWPPGDPGSEVGGKGAPGTVRVVSTPRGAEVWMLAGLGPEALVEQLPCDQPIEVLVAGPTTFRKRLHAAPADFGPRPGETSSKIAKLSAK